MPAVRTCIDCDDIIGPGESLCTLCKRERHREIETSRGTANDRGYTKTWRLVSERLRRESPICSECGATDDLTVDHIVPKKLGGTDDEDNLRVVCRPCNSAKRDR